MSTNKRMAAAGRGLSRPPPPAAEVAAFDSPGRSFRLSIPDIAIDPDCYWTVWVV